MDLATIIGLVMGVVTIVVVLILDGGSPGELFKVPQAILLIFGGSIAATMISTKLSSTMALPKFVMLAIKGQNMEGAKAIDLLTKMADKARKEGLLALEEESKKIDDPFLRKGVMMVVDGVDPAQVRAILEIEIEHMEERHGVGIGYFTAAGGFAPTFGIIGTVMGLIGVLKELDDPNKLAHSIAAAFLATLWGLLFSNMIYLPLGNKLKQKSGEEVAYRKLLVEGIISLQAGENPRLVKEKLSAFLPPKTRPQEADAAPAGKKAKAQA
jgi:chemotaxis protein MotA